MNRKFSILIFMMILSLVAPVYSAEKFNLFETHHVSELASEISEDFSGYDTGSIIDTRPNLSFPADMIGFSEAEKNRQRQALAQLQTDLNEAVSRGDKEFVIKKDYYRISSEATVFKIVGASDMVIDGSGSDFINEIRSKIVEVSDCKNLTLKNIKLDADPLYTTQGVIVDLDKANSAITILVDNGYNIPTSSIVGDRLMFYSKDGTRQISAGYNDVISTFQMVGPKTFKVTQVNGNSFADGLGLEVGCRAAIPTRGGGSALAVTRSDSCTFLNVDIYSAPGFGVREYLGEGGHTYDHLRIIRRPDTSRMLSVSADGFHSTQVKKGPLIINSEIGHAEDDLLNIQGFMDIVYKQVDPVTLYVAVTAENSFFEGSTVEFHNIENLKQITEAKVVSISSDVPAFIAGNAPRCPAEIGKQLSIAIRELMPGKMIKIVLDRPVSVRPYDLVYSYDTCGLGAVIKDSYFHDSYVRGLLLSGDCVFENNVVARTSGQALLINSDSYWLEGPNVKNISIKNNKFIDCSLGKDKKSIGTIAIGTFGRGKKAFTGQHYENIEIINNEFNDSNTCAIFVINGKNIAIKDNKITNSWCYPIPRFTGKGYDIGQRDFFSAIYIDESVGVTLDSNEITGNPDWVGDIYNNSK